jgi:hypothetical protein
MFGRRDSIRNGVFTTTGGYTGAATNYTQPAYTVNYNNAVNSTVQAPASAVYTYQPTAIPNLNVNDQEVKNRLLDAIYDNILIDNVNRDYLARLAYIVNNNHIIARKAEVVTLIDKIVENSTNTILNKIGNGPYGDEYIAGLAQRINQGLDVHLAQLGVDWRVYQNPITDSVIAHKTTVATPSTTTQMYSAINDVTVPVNSVTGNNNYTAAQQSSRINDAIIKLRKLVQDCGFTDMDNAKKLKKFWDANFIRKYKNYADLEFGQIWQALMA